ncbi:MAG: hypothetical protein UV61_C0003G0096 [Candidatus Gottesmanbacteria bacterium GW2011_GWB1_43_11]|uniref:Cupin 2 conserved barrel domain-containing protein n=1 Tax=Candidatus Gottesmanbacteria bacterium GW2011_GWB1_43_11 TaxID=1618446 RepID=A0A0G1FK44_9BACT|nr:MAG: hypothetical protein UV04_C0029G0002 [Candidatus Gottesmanbacteria bacterium GW2011_GWA2_42_16]KKS54625.1 MAG: hypothetical protein UV17_C0016G0038 [Candidatus Gottesmanbacteria bacterium GW2011_GWA1_42_26]KKS80420.1 MAG: hypothetical protein UV55_C0039G0002 [Candidatus Gottesmanbacteria bacterium GW2011_GWC1_43_10]KKS87243.1 MAG: hypothetical protein UV61_C0003G0096 [Candidatus Gottesmanbacteria bacterium GW2011_GWB1_43_11]OGG10622.1 MAG: hypothetical protein A2699_03400 [Candidatus Go
MKPQKYSFSETRKVDLGSKVIYEYPTFSKSLSIAKMVVKGRHPKNPETFILEHVCQFVIYILSGSGKIYVGEGCFDMAVGDAVFVPKEHTFAVEGSLEYITVDNPAFFPEQSEEVHEPK